MVNTPMEKCFASRVIKEIQGKVMRYHFAWKFRKDFANWLCGCEELNTFDVL